MSISSKFCTFFGTETFLVFFCFLCCTVLNSSLLSTLCNPMDCSPPGPFVHGESPVANARVGCHALLQGIFLTQGSSPGLLHCRQILNHLSHQGSPTILQWVAYPTPGILPNAGIEPESPALKADSLSAELPGKPILFPISL